MKRGGLRQGLTTQPPHATAELNGFSVFVVWKSSSYADPAKVPFYVAAATNTAYRAGITATGGGVRVGGRRLNTDAFASVSQPSKPNNEMVITGGVFDYVNARLTSFDNGVEYDLSGDFQTPGFTPNNQGESSIGGRINLSNGTFVDYLPSGSWVGEIITFDRALTQQEVTSVNQYLKFKWGL